MKRLLQFIILFCASLFNLATAQETALFPIGEIGKNTGNYSGTIWLNELNHPDSNFTFSIAQAVYAPGSRLDWHLHPGGQYLLITDGSGYYQEKGKAVQVVNKGDVVKCTPGIEHWHATTPGSTFAYFGVTTTQKRRTVWLQKVTDAEYNAAL